MLFQKATAQTKTPIGEAIEQYLNYNRESRRLSRITLRGQKYALKVFSDFTMAHKIKYIEVIDNDALNRWLMELTSEGRQPKPVKRNTANGYMSHLRSFLSWCRDMQISVQVQFGTIERLAPERVDRIVFSRKQVNEALNHANEMEWLLIKLCFDCGLRLGELSQIHVADIHGDRIRIHGKGRKDADVFISPEVERRLRDWIDSENITGYLWRGRDPHRHLSDAQVRRYMRKPFYKIGLTDFHPHALRYSCATEAYDIMGSSDMTKEILRHSNVKTTELYIQTSTEHRRRVFQEARYAQRLIAIDKSTLN